MRYKTDLLHFVQIGKVTKIENGRHTYTVLPKVFLAKKVENGKKFQLLTLDLKPIPSSVKDTNNRMGAFFICKQRPVGNFFDGVKLSVEEMKLWENENVKLMQADEEDHYEPSCY